MTPQRALAALALGLASCTDPAPPSSAALPIDLELAGQRAVEERDRVAREDRERWAETVDPGELAEHVRLVPQAAIEDGSASLERIFAQGESFFERRFTAHEGLGTALTGRPRPGLGRVQSAPGRHGGDAMSCADCHARGGDDGHGELHQRAWIGGDGTRLSSGHPRLAPHVAGVGLVQALAAEMTVDLAEQLRYATMVFAADGATTSIALRTHGVELGELRRRDDGTVDLAGVRGVGPDLVVRPFGWRGTRATLREFLEAATRDHMGLEPEGTDADLDGIATEVTAGQITSLAVYLALLDAPRVIPPIGDETRAAWEHGSAHFDELGCGDCHRRSLPLRSTRWEERVPGSERSLAIDVVADVQVAPAAERGPPPIDLEIEVPLFSDLRRHDLGEGLAERDEPDLGRTTFVTRPLWGIADRRYFLHDGRARTFGEATLAHGGEASAAAEAYRALTERERAELDVFLLSLRRAPQGRLSP